MKMATARDTLRYNLVFWRAKRQLSQALVAERAEVSRPLISEIEQGRANVTLDVLERVAGALDVSVSQLLEPVRAATTDADIERRAGDGDDAFVDSEDFLATIDDRAPGASDAARYSKRGRKPAVSR